MSNEAIRYFSSMTVRLFAALIINISYENLIRYNSVMLFFTYLHFKISQIHKHASLIFYPFLHYSYFPISLFVLK